MLKTRRRPRPLLSVNTTFQRMRLTLRQERMKRGREEVGTYMLPRSDFSVGHGRHVRKRSPNDELRSCGNCCICYCFSLSNLDLGRTLLPDLMYFSFYSVSHGEQSDTYN